MPSGKFLLISSIISFTLFATSTALAPGSMYIPKIAAFSPLMPLSVLYDCASNDILATSRSLIKEPSGLARNTISSNCPTVERRPCVVIGVVMSIPDIGALPNSPAADSLFWSFKLF